MKKRPARKAKKLGKKPLVRKASLRKSQKIDESLLNLPHSSVGRITKSLEKIESFSSDLAEKSGLAGVLGRAVLLRASAIRESLRLSKKKKSSKTKAK